MKRLLLLVVFLVTRIADGQPALVSAKPCRMDGADCFTTAYSNLTGISASKLLGRGSSGGTGAAQEITLGAGLSMSGTTLDATGGGLSGLTPGTIPKAASATTLDDSYLQQGTNVISQRNGANAQAFHLYGAYTDASNYERLALSTTAGSGVSVAAETAGSGADNLDVTINPAGTGKVRIGGTYLVMPGGTAVEMWASATPSWGFDVSSVTKLWYYDNKFGLGSGVRLAGGSYASEDVFLERAEAALWKVTSGIQYVTGTRPTCDATHRGSTWYVAGGAGVADTFEVCVKQSSDVYAWIALATIP